MLSWDGSMWNRLDSDRPCVSTRPVPVRTGALKLRRRHLSGRCAKNNIRAEEMRQSLFFELRPSFFVHCLSRPIWNCFTCFHEYGASWDRIRKQNQLKPTDCPKWNCSKQSRGNARRKLFQPELVPWIRCLRAPA